MSDQSLRTQTFRAVGGGGEAEAPGGCLGSFCVDFPDFSRFFLYLAGVFCYTIKVIMDIYTKREDERGRRR